MHCGVEVTELSTNKLHTHTLSLNGSRSESRASRETLLGSCCLLLLQDLVDNCAQEGGGEEDSGAKSTRAAPRHPILISVSYLRASIGKKKPCLAPEKRSGGERELARARARERDGRKRERAKDSTAFPS